MNKMVACSLCDIRQHVTWLILYRRLSSIMRTAQPQDTPAKDIALIVNSFSHVSLRASVLRWIGYTLLMFLG